MFFEWVEKEPDPYYILNVALGIIGLEKAKACFNHAGY